MLKSGRRPTAAGPSRSAEPRASGGSAARGAGATRCAPARSSRLGAGPSKSITPPMCMCDPSRSCARNDASTERQAVHVVGHLSPCSPRVPGGRAYFPDGFLSIGNSHEAALGSPRGRRRACAGRRVDRDAGSAGAAHRAGHDDRGRGRGDRRLHRGAVRRSPPRMVAGAGLRVPMGGRRGLRPVRRGLPGVCPGRHVDHAAGRPWRSGRRGGGRAGGRVRAAARGRAPTARSVAGSGRTERRRRARTRRCAHPGVRLASDLRGSGAARAPRRGGLCALTARRARPGWGAARARRTRARPGSRAGIRGAHRRPLSPDPAAGRGVQRRAPGRGGRGDRAAGRRPRGLAYHRRSRIGARGGRVPAGGGRRAGARLAAGCRDLVDPAAPAPGRRGDGPGAAGTGGRAAAGAHRSGRRGAAHHPSCGDRRGAGVDRTDRRQPARHHGGGRPAAGRGDRARRPPRTAGQDRAGARPAGQRRGAATAQRPQRARSPTTASASRARTRRPTTSWANKPTTCW